MKILIKLKRYSVKNNITQILFIPFTPFFCNQSIYISGLMSMGKTRPCMPSHALSSPRPKPTRPLPAVRSLGVLLTIDQGPYQSTYTKLAEGVFYPSGLHLPKRLMAWFIPGVNHALGSNCYPRLRAFTANNFFGTLLKEYKPLPLWHF